MIISANLSIVSAILALLPTPQVSAHGYLKSPRSRNYFAHTDGKWWGGTASDPKPENCPHCLNIGGTEARCGLIEDRNYDFPLNSLGGSMPPVVQACYKPGAVVEFETMLTAYHMGHFEYFACPISAGEVPAQACFDANPLTFISDENYGATPDPLYPERAYIPNNDYQGLIKDGDMYRFNHKYQLPANLSGDLVLIQWHYVTGNSCKDIGYDTYNWPTDFYPGNIPVCSQPLPPDGRGVPEQFWNCAEVKISSTCDGPDPPTSSSTTSTTTSSSSVGTGATVTTSVATTTTGLTTTGATQDPRNCAAEDEVCGPNNPCSNGMCCSQWGYCGTTEAYCTACCQSNCWDDPNPTSATSTTSTTSVDNLPPYTADHGEDSRLIAYVGNWQSCPTDEQVSSYSHIVIAFAVSYTWSASKNNCDQQCNIAETLPICNNANNQALVDKWHDMGKKVIFSFGGAGMGGSWSGDNNNCWDYCYGKEEELSTSLVNIVDSQNFDGIDIDYEYCYDVDDLQAGRCSQRTNLYTDAKAQTFLDSLTSKLRTKLDALQATNGYSRGRYEITHAPMDVDVARSDSKYYELLKNRRNDLDFIMPQFYNGVTRPGVDGFDGHNVGAMSSATLYSLLADDLFDHEPNKVIFGFCISDCSGTGSNINANQAVQVLSAVKTYSEGEFSCNGGAFFWVALHDTNGSWSKAVRNEVSQTAGCSNPSSTTTTSTTINTAATTSSATTTTTIVTTQPPQSSTTTTASTVLTTTTSSTNCDRNLPFAKSIKLESTTGQVLHILEINVYSSGIKQSTSATASQSSTLNSFVASRANDDSESTFTHTKLDDKSAWLRLDFSREIKVEPVEIVNRWCISTTDPYGCLCRLSYARLSLMDSNGSIIAQATLGDTCAKLSITVDFDYCSTASTGATTSTTTVPGNNTYPKAQVIKLNSITGNELNMIEFQVVSGGLNVAQGKTASQSSTYGNKYASNAVDGSTSTFSHTNDRGFSWWMVDLGQPFDIESINIVNRYCVSVQDQSRCLCRLSHAVISLHDAEGEWITTISIGDTCGKLEWSYDFGDQNSTCTAWS